MSPRLAAEAAERRRQGIVRLHRSGMSVWLVARRLGIPEEQVCEALVVERKRSR